MTIALTGKQARHLRGLGHSLKPLLQLGKSGVSPEFLQKVGEHLERHELIKIKMLQNCTLDLAQVGVEIAENLNCGVAQKIGKTLLLYRPRQKDPVIVLPSAN